MKKLKNKLLICMFAGLVAGGVGCAIAEGPSKNNSLGYVGLVTTSLFGIADGGNQIRKGQKYMRENHKYLNDSN
jgi:hypothetical protein